MDDEEGVAAVLQLHECFASAPTFITLRKAMLLVVRIHWGDAAAHGSDLELLRGLVYHGNPESGEVKSLRVDLAHALGQKDRTPHPRIIIEFPGGVTYTKKVVDSSLDVDAAGGSRSYMMVASTSMRVSFLHRSADTALAMAEDTMLYLFATRSSLMCNLTLLGLDLTGMSEPMLVKESAETYFKVDLSAKLTFNPSVKVTRTGLKLKKWITQIDAREEH